MEWSRTQRGGIFLLTRFGKYCPLRFVPATSLPWQLFPMKVHGLGRMPIFLSSEGRPHCWGKEHRQWHHCECVWFPFRSPSKLQRPFCVHVSHVMLRGVDRSQWVRCAFWGEDRQFWLFFLWARGRRERCPYPHLLRRQVWCFTLTISETHRNSWVVW